MGRYATHTAWLPSMGGQSLISGLTSTVVTTQTVIGELTRAEGFIDSFLSKLYAPSAYATSPTVIMLTEDITTFRLYSNYIYNRPEGISSDAQTQLIESRYNISLATLEQIRDNKLELVTSDGTIIDRKNETSSFFISTRNYSATFGEDNPIQWAISGSKLEDIAARREND